MISLSQDLTLEVVPEIDPVTTSLNLYVPIPVSNGGGAIVTPGALKYPTPASIIRISVDTCHSGTFSNFCYKLTDEYTHKQVTKKEPYFNDAYSISACNDNELDACDIGKVGFGGSLTVHLLDDNNFNEFIFGDKIKVKNNLCKILKLLKQEPILLVDMI